MLGPSNPSQVFLHWVFSAQVVATLALLRGIDLLLPLRAGGPTGHPRAVTALWFSKPILEKDLPITELSELQMAGCWSVTPLKYAKYISAERKKKII